MAFKPFRDSRPMEERPIEIQVEAVFFQYIRDVQPPLSKKQQGKVMGAFREITSRFKLEVKDEKGSN
ncbi:hypothetical protein QJS83_14860 [Bdellovibrio sp. 22V]|uniref:hypothetical protein n=1 Tax=Bdellovibrio sp. 22V TaxID=3044166 RepID=UPI002542E16D|nr:hypothetical protein [Bdellovibrio sp. 22V]WII71743.1 hypothetical protein QJS83_14860 [Bdellovibrio sp. 22V]